MATYDDPIVNEVHETRMKLLAKYGGSEGYAQHLRELETELSERIVTREPRRPKTVEKKVS
jgi:hypothetical protein